jgi:peroxiredoxin (alkyl hydroperoxide reductase subunit C)
MPAFMNNSQRPEDNNNNNNNNNSNISNNNRNANSWNSAQSFGTESQNSKFCCQSLVQFQAPHFNALFVKNQEVGQVSLNNYVGNYLVMFFYPRNFSTLCMSELTAISEASKSLENYNCKVLAISTENIQSHKALTTLTPEMGGVGQINIPLLADGDKFISANYGVLLNNENPARATIIIDPRGIVRSVMVNDIAVGRNVDEIIRNVAAISTADKKSEFCLPTWTTANSKTQTASPVDAPLYFPNSNSYTKA